MCEVWFRCIHAEFIKVFVEGGSLEFREVERDGREVVCILSQQIMPAQVVFRQLDKVLGRWRRIIWKDLRVDVAAELLNSYLVISRFRVSCSL